MKLTFLLKITVLAMTGSLVGCATPIVKIGGYEGLSSSDATKATVFVYRDKEFAGSANRYDVLIGKDLVGSLPNGSFFSVTTPPGETQIKADTAPFGKGSSLTVEADKVYCFKLKLNWCLSCESADIIPVDNAQCEIEMKPLTRVRLK